MAKGNNQKGNKEIKKPKKDKSLLNTKPSNVVNIKKITK